MYASFTVQNEQTSEMKVDKPQEIMRLNRLEMSLRKISMFASSMFSATLSLNRSISCR